MCIFSTRSINKVIACEVHFYWSDGERLNWEASRRSVRGIRKGIGFKPSFHGGEAISRSMVISMVFVNSLIKIGGEKEVRIASS